VIDALDALKKDERFRKLLEDNLVTIKSVPENLASKVEPYIDSGAAVFTFMRYSQRDKIASIEPKVNASYLDIPEGFPDGAYVPLPEIVVMALGRYLGICKPQDMPETTLNELNLDKIPPPAGNTLIFRLLPKPLRIDTDEESVRRYVLLKQFLAAV
jgi:hypothetical protein